MCSCKGGCVTRRCSCFKAGKRCGEDCYCTSCVNTSKDVDNDADNVVVNDAVENDTVKTSVDKSYDAVLDAMQNLNVSENDNEEDNNNKKNTTYKDLNVCNCGSMCDTNRCPCKKFNRKCDPSRCGCCTRYGKYCFNCDTNVMPYSQPKISSPIKSFNTENFYTDEYLYIASWNIQSFGHNRGSRKYTATIERIVEFINVYNIDCFFIQETVNPEAIDDLTNAFNEKMINENDSRKLTSSVIDIGKGFNKSNAGKRLNPRVTEYAAVLCRNEYIDNDTLVLEKIDDILKNTAHADDEPGTERVFKRDPAFFTIKITKEDVPMKITCITLHLSSDSNAQIIQLNEELRSLPMLYGKVKDKTSADHVIILGDLNRTFVDSNNADYPFNGLSSILSPVLSDVKTNTSKLNDELYDNFWVSDDLVNIVSGKVANEFLKIYSDENTDTSEISDHYPIILSIKLKSIEDNNLVK